MDKKRGVTTVDIDNSLNQGLIQRNDLWVFWGETKNPYP